MNSMIDWDSVDLSNDDNFFFCSVCGVPISKDKSLIMYKGTIYCKKHYPNDMSDKLAITPENLKKFSNHEIQNPSSN